MKTLSQTQHDHRKGFIKRTADFTKDHVVQLIDGEGAAKLYRCAKPGTFNYGFFVAFLPYAVVVYGDIGTMVVEHRSHEDMLPWVRGSVDSIDYFFEKSGVARDREEFLPDYARAWNEEEAIQAQEQGETEYASALRELSGSDFESSHAMYQAVEDAGGQDVFESAPSWHEWSDEDLRCAAALSRFIQILDQRDTATPTAPTTNQG